MSTRMIQKSKYIFATFALVLGFVATVVASPQAVARPICPNGEEMVGSTCPAPDPADAGTTGGSCPERVLTFPAWYKGVIDTSTCEVKITSILDLIKIPLNFISMLIQAVAYAAAGFVLWGGFKYMKSQGDPGKIAEAKSAIINAVTGLAIALLSVGIVEFVQGRFS